MAESRSGTESGSGAAADLRTAWVEIDLGALVRNYRALARHVAPSSILAVVKADAYGHGAVEVARALEPEGAAAFGVATLREGVELREAGIEAPVLVLSPVPDDGFDALLGHRLTPVLSSLEQLAAIAARVDAARAELPVHLKFDTGMSRLGIDADDAAAAFARLERSPGLRLAGLMSHLAEAESPESAANEQQIALFRDLLASRCTTATPGPVHHLANSAAALHLPAARYDQVRLGISLYGYDSASWSRPRIPLEPVMSVRAGVIQIREIPAGRRVGYGGRFLAEVASRIAIVPLGYADGYSWRLGRHADVLLRDRRVPVAGAVSMDLLAIDATGVDVRLGDPVTLLGAQDGKAILAPELAAQIDSIPYQLLCLFGLRLPRRYLRSPAPESAS
ncbi:MAG: alanine racemase [Thermoanaerobaculia bacterium]